MLFKLEDAIDKMAERFAVAGRDVAAWPIEPGHSETEVAEVEKSLGVRLPPTFRSIILRFDFLRAVAGNVAMSHATNLEQWLVDPNVDPPRDHGVRWWVGSEKPPNLLYIAGSDGHSYYLNVDDGFIMATCVDDRSQRAFAIASSFAKFYTALATLYLEGLGTEAAVGMAADVSEYAGADPAAGFWTTYARGGA